MMRSVSLAIAILGVSACANSFAKVRDAAAGAPEWYDEAREEIIGEGYPDLGSMPSLSQEELDASSNALTMSREDILAAQRLFATDKRAITPVTTDIEMRALKDRLQAKLAASGPAPTGTPSDHFLTAADIERIRKIFERAELR